MELKTRLRASVAALDAAMDALLSAERETATALALVLLTDPDPVPAPPPSIPSPPPPEPSPPPAPPSGPPRALLRQPINLAAVVAIRGHFSGGRYDRMEGVSIVDGSSMRLELRGLNIAAGGSDRNLSAGEYVVSIDGETVASTTIVITSPTLTFDIDVSTRAGWGLVQVACPGQDCPAWPVFFNKPNALRGPMPVVTGTYGLSHPPRGETPTHVVAWVPATFQPTTLPLAPREFPALTDLPGRHNLVQEQLVICRPDDTDRPCITDSGVWTTSNRQSYFFSDLADKRLMLAVLDGPRGMAALPMVTHLQVGRRGSYAVTPWSVVRIELDGTVRTLAGRRSTNPPSFWGDKNLESELVGNWDAIPEDRRGFHEPWGLAWDEASLATDTTATPIPNGGTVEQPHLTGPRAFVPDLHNGRICLLTFDPASHETPCVVTEFITGLGEPWDCVCRGGVLYVSERTSNRVAMYDATTGEFKGVFAAAARPEGLDYMDEWIYFGSKSMKAIRRRHIVTGVEEEVCRPLVDGNSLFVKFAVSRDGTVLPKGGLAVCTWSNTRYGYPQLFRDGREIDGWLWSGTNRQGKPWVGQHGLAAPGYPTAVALGGGRMLCATSQEGVMQMSRALPTDPPTSPSHDSWAAAWWRHGFDLTHGPMGFGYFGLPLPWGASPETDRYLETWGHVRPV